MPRPSVIEETLPAVYAQVVSAPAASVTLVRAPFGPARVMVRFSDVSVIVVGWVGFGDDE